MYITKLIKKLKIIMTNIDNREMLFQAIDHNPILTKNPKKILKILCMYNKPVPVKILVESSNLVKQIVYPCLSRMLKSGLVIKSKSNFDAYYLYEVNKIILSEFLDLHEKTLIIKRNLL